MSNRRCRSRRASASFISHLLFPVSCFLFPVSFSCSEPTIQITTETFKRKQEEPFPRESAIFDGKRVRLRAARGETLGVQVMRRGREAVRLELPKEAAAVHAFEVRGLR